MIFRIATLLLFVLSFVAIAKCQMGDESSYGEYALKKRFRGEPIRFGKRAPREPVRFGKRANFAPYPDFEPEY